MEHYKLSNCGKFYDYLEFSKHVNQLANRENEEKICKNTNNSNHSSFTCNSNRDDDDYNNYNHCNKVIYNDDNRNNNNDNNYNNINYNDINYNNSFNNNTDDNANFIKDDNNWFLSENDDEYEKINHKINYYDNYSNFIQFINGKKKNPEKKRETKTEMNSLNHDFHANEKKGRTKDNNDAFDDMGGEGYGFADELLGLGIGIRNSDVQVRESTDRNQSQHPSIDPLISTTPTIDGPIHPLFLDPSDPTLLNLVGRGGSIEDQAKV
jgi:hypothetical protein